MLIQFLHKCREGFKTPGLSREGASGRSPMRSWAFGAFLNTTLQKNKQSISLHARD